MVSTCYQELQDPKNSSVFFMRLQYCGGFCHTLTQPQVHMCPPILTPSPTSLTIPSLWVVPVLQLCCPASCIELELVIYFTYGNLQVSILSNHPTLTFSHRVQKSSLHLCLFCCLEYRVVIIIFLNSIHMH